MHATFAASAAPWYRHRWPWLLMAGPGIVVVAGLFTVWLAVTSDDGLVAQDYYKRGLLINRQLEKSTRATGIAARVSLSADGAVQVRVSGAASLPATLRLQLAHPTRAGRDRSALLQRSGDDTYASRIEPLPAGRWLVTLEGDAWRLPSIEITAPFADLDLGDAAVRPTP